MAAAIEAGRVEAEHTWAMKAWRIILILSAAQFILVLDTTVMNVSISNVLADLNTNVESAQLAITAYMLVMASTRWSTAARRPIPQPRRPVPGTYTATLTLTDNEGCSTTFVSAGQTAFCNGSAQASKTETVKVAFPGVRLRCPKRAKPGGCKFKLMAVTRKRKGRIETRVARSKVKAGRSTIVSPKPKRAFATKLATAKKVLVKETVTINGSRRIRFKKLKIVQ